MGTEHRTGARLDDPGKVSGLSSVDLDRPTTRIGRSQKNDIVIRELTVSGMHAAIEQQPDGHRVVDLGSTNKTLLNGEEIPPHTPMMLSDGDEIRIDTFVFIYRASIQEPTASYSAADISTSPSPADDDATVLFEEDTDTNTEETLLREKKQPAADDEDGDETVLFDSGAAMQAEDFSAPGIQPPDAGDADGDETVFFDSEAAMEAENISTPEMQPPDAEDGDGDETVFFDSGAAMEAEDISTSEMRPPDAEDGDGDETVFFDSEAVLEKGSGGQCVPAAPGSPAVKTIGNYQALKLLGRGGFGSVWKACSPAGRTVAVKELNPEILDNDRAVRKFFHEAIILSRLDHPNICAFIDFFPHEGNYAIVMDFVEGIDLKDMLEEQKGPLPLKTAVSIASQTLDAFHYALEKQVLHRDIKPENITVDTNGVAKVMDFGIARLSSSESQQTSLFMISPAYTAPERFDANKADLVDHRSDIYSLGLLFYEIFTGAHPFPVTSPVDMIRAHLSTAPTPPDQVAEIPRKISDGILQALEKDPEDRFPDFASFKMAMLGEPPLRTSKSLGIIEFSGDQCKSSATLFKTLAGLLKKHQKNAAHISIGQGGTKVHLIVETVGGTTIRIQRDIDKP